MFENIDQGLDYLYSFINLEKKHVKSEYSLTNIKRLFQLFEQPQLAKKIFHVAGTKGKGSTCLFISQLLRQVNFNVLTFLSPHLNQPHERFLYNLEPISDQDFLEIINQIKKKLDQSTIIPTTFELFVLIAFLYGSHKDTDYYVIETGLGGRLDCTNIIDPLLSIITTIGFDHTQILGKTIKKIAREKAGIIKKNTPFVLARQIYSCETIFKNAGKQQNSPVYWVKKQVKLLKIRYLPRGMVIDFCINQTKISGFFLPLLGKHQVENFFNALLAVSIFHAQIIERIDQKKTLPILIPARVQLLRSNPPLILDTAHNKESAQNLCHTMNKHFPGQKWLILSGMAVDKDYLPFYKPLKKMADHLIITSLSEYKKSDPEKIYQDLKKKFGKIELIKDLDLAIKKALESNQPLIIAGSFYLAGPFLKTWQKSNYCSR